MHRHLVGEEMEKISNGAHGSYVWQSEQSQLDIQPIIRGFKSQTKIKASLKPLPWHK